MKKVFLAILFAALSCHSPALAGSFFDDLSSLEKDAYVHFGAGVLVSHVSYPIFKHYVKDQRKAVWYAIGLTALLSAAKELSDQDTTGFSGSDLAAGVLGGLTIVVVHF
jgi:hypothetical protein